MYDKTVSEGAGQVRAISRLALNSTIKTGKIRPLYDSIDDLFRKTGKDMKQAMRVVIASTASGGTGSGMTPIMTDILSRRFADKHFVIIEVYPPIMESIGAQQNGLDYLKEIRSFLPNAVYMQYDNNRRANLTTPEMLQSVNEEIVDHLLVFRGDYLYPTPFNSIDEKDMMRFISTPGRMAVYVLDDIKEKDFDDRSLEDALLDIIKNGSTNVELDRDKIVKRLGVISNLNPTLNKIFNVNMTKIKEFIGKNLMNS